MFDNEKKFYGKHASYVKFLCKDKNVNTENGLNLFESKIELYTLAPLIGLIYNRKSKIDRSIDDTSTIQLQQIKNHEDDLIYVYRVIMLLDDKENISDEKRIERAFKYDDDKKRVEENMKIFDSYALGGIEFLYEMFKDDLISREDLLFHIGDLLDFNEFDERY